jgi:hypothetical protein
MAVLTLLACGARPLGPELPENALRVLLIGNSLAYWNDLPLMLEALADSGRAEPPAGIPTYSSTDPTGSTPLSPVPTLPRSSSSHSWSTRRSSVFRTRSGCRAAH